MQRDEQSAESAVGRPPQTPCGARVCTGCATCIKAWAGMPRANLAQWQIALVDRIFPPGSVTP